MPSLFLALIFLFLPSSLLAEDRHSVRVKATMKKVMCIQMDKQDLTIDPFATGTDSIFIFPKALTLRISYNGFKNIKIALNDNQDDLGRNLKYFHFTSRNNAEKKIRYQLYSSRDKKILSRQETLFVLESSHEPLVNFAIPLDIIIEKKELIKALAGCYSCELNLCIIEEG